MNSHDIIIKFIALCETMELLQWRTDQKEQREVVERNVVIAKLLLSELGIHTVPDLQDSADQAELTTWCYDVWACFEENIPGLYFNVFMNRKRRLKQEAPEVMERFVELLKNQPISKEKKALFQIYISQCCCSSAPELSFTIVMDALHTDPAVLGSCCNFRKDYVFAETFFDGQKEFTECPVCGGQGSPFHCATSWEMGSFNKVHLPAKLWMRCSKCGNLYSRYFSKKFLECAAGYEIIQPEENVECECPDIGVYALRSWCNILQSTRPYTEGTDLLEVGVGKEGGMVAAAFDMGFSVDCVEIDVERAHKMANILQTPIICCDFLNFSEEKKYSVISMGDVIEHMSNPRKGLEKAYRLLEDNGVVWISTPNYESARNRLSGMRAVLWIEPTHVTYFNRTGLLTLLEEIGFEVLDYRISEHYDGSMEVLARKSHARE